jgi:hypothetical protein
MEYRKIDNVWVIVLKKGERIIEKLREFVKEKKIKSGYFNAIGAVSSVELAHYNLKERKYTTRLINSPLEIVSLIGNVTEAKSIHAHIALGTDEMELYGGHLKEAVVAATCEIIFYEFSEMVNRKYNKEIGLNLISAF